MRPQEGIERACLGSEGSVERGVGCTTSHLEPPVINWQDHPSWFWHVLCAEGHAGPQMKGAHSGALWKYDGLRTPIEAVA